MWNFSIIYYSYNLWWSESLFCNNDNMSSGSISFAMSTIIAIGGRFKWIFRFTCCLFTGESFDRNTSIFFGMTAIAFLLYMVTILNSLISWKEIKPNAPMEELSIIPSLVIVSKLLIFVAFKVMMLIRIFLTIMDIIELLYRSDIMQGGYCYD